MSRTREVIVQLLQNIGGRKEVSEYLRHYTNAETQRSLIVTFARDVDVRARSEEVASALSFLSEVGTRAVVLVVGRDVVLALADALESRECRARPITGGVLGADGQVDDSEVQAAWRASAMPIVAIDEGTAIHAVRAMASKLLPHKIVVLDDQGGLVDQAHQRVDAINLEEDRELWEAALNDEQRARFDRFVTLIDNLQADSEEGTLSLSVTAPSDLARELFTHRGAGTLIRRGEAINVYPSFDDVDTPRLRALVETCFGRNLRADYFDTRVCRRVYVTANYRGTAIVTQENNLPPYLDKFAVTTKAQGEGIGGSLWRRFRVDHPTVFWRSRSANPINPWYFSQADGSYLAGHWTIFWCGIENFHEVARCVEAAQQFPETLDRAE